MSSEEHVCTVCFQVVSNHDECEGECWPPCCCPGCDCGTTCEEEPMGKGRRKDGYGLSPTGRFIRMPPDPHLMFEYGRVDPGIREQTAAALAEFDYGRLEYRMLAMGFQEKPRIHDSVVYDLDLTKCDDPHSRLAEAMFGEVTAEGRDAAKTVLFGAMYGCPEADLDEFSRSTRETIMACQAEVEKQRRMAQPAYQLWGCYAEVP